MRSWRNWITRRTCSVQWILKSTKISIVSSREEPFYTAILNIVLWIHSGKLSMVINSMWPCITTLAAFRLCFIVRLSSISWNKPKNGAGYLARPRCLLFLFGKRFSVSWGRHGPEVVIAKRLMSNNLPVQSWASLIDNRNIALMKCTETNPMITD